MSWAIIVHGGAHPVADHKIDASDRACLAAVDAGAAILERGGSALDAVEAAIRVLEDDPVFNAGYGSALNADGEVENDAALMEGEKLAAGAVASIRGVRNPISAARKVMETEHVLLSGEGARRFAEQSAVELCEPNELIHENQRGEWEASKKTRGSDTVGAVAMDTRGTFAAGTSTGGLMHKRPGRIGDSPLVGLGLYADNAAGGVSMTGDGEMIMRMALAHRVTNSMCNGADADRASEEAIAAMERRVGGEAGCIAIDRHGQIGQAHNTSHMPTGWRTSEMPAAAASVKKEH
jgi:beta-aspartyl-peptidase (threonine type)